MTKQTDHFAHKLNATLKTLKGLSYDELCQKKEFALMVIREMGEDSPTELIVEYQSVSVAAGRAYRALAI